MTEPVVGYKVSWVHEGQHMHSFADTKRAARVIVQRLKEQEGPRDIRVVERVMVEREVTL